MELVGYARISKGEQNINNQIEALKHAGCTTIFEDIISGSTNINKRNGLKACLEYMKEGDVLVVTRFDRLGRLHECFFQVSKTLEARKLNLKSLSENVDTSTMVGKMFYFICGLFAEMELNAIRERTKAGLESCRQRGYSPGRPRALPVNHLESLAIMHAKNLTIKDIANAYKISTKSVTRYVAEAKRKGLYPYDIQKASLEKVREEKTRKVIESMGILYDHNSISHSGQVSNL